MKLTFLLVHNAIVLIQFNLTFHLISNSFSISFNNEIYHVYILLFVTITIILRKTAVILEVINVR